MIKILGLKMIIKTLSTNTLTNLRFFSTTKVKSLPSQNMSGGLNDDERRYLSESLERAGALMTNLRMHRNDIYEYLDELGENEEAQGELQDQLRELWTETEFTEDAIDINRFLLYGEQPGIKNFESWSRVRNDIGAHNADDNVNYDNLYINVEQVIRTTYPQQELEYQWSITESLAPYNPICLPSETVNNESQNETSGQENIESSKAYEPESKTSEQENVERSANVPKDKVSGQKDAEVSQAGNSSMTDDQEDLGSVLENMFDPKSDMHKTTNSQKNTLNQDSAAKDNSSNSDNLENTSNQDSTVQVNTSTQSVPTQDSSKEGYSNEDSIEQGPSNNNSKEGISNSDKGSSSDNGKGGPPSPQGKGSILDDFADTSTELPDYMGGDY